MRINIRNIDINYIQYGSGKKDILLLHGWGQNIEMMKFLGDPLSRDYRITILDFPGFGESKEPENPWTIQDYYLMLKDFVTALHIQKPIVMGHSFGGRVAIRYAGSEKIEKLVLFGSPCIRKQEKLSTKTKILKTLKKVPGLNCFSDFAKKHIGSRDYKAATPVMRETLVNVINEDLSMYAKQISAPTLLIWGDQDTEAPVEDARELEQLIPDAGLIVFPGCSHYAYLENLNQVLTILKNFL